MPSNSLLKEYLLDQGFINGQKRGRTPYEVTQKVESVLRYFSEVMELIEIR